MSLMIALQSGAGYLPFFLPLFTPAACAVLTCQ
jgi:hypothetical protein